ncbi:MAG: FtsX-like permease family protein [Coprobacillaceae bacterium]
MYTRIIKNDFLRSKLTTITTAAFVAVASMLISLVAILGVNLAGSIDTLMTKAKTPHFMQMHSGDIDVERLSEFASENKGVEEFQVVEFVNIENAKITINGDALDNSILDNGFVKQSKNFDYLLDFDNNVIDVKPGEIYLPISYMKDNIAKVGDTAKIAGKEFIIAGFARDSQMNSPLASSQRWLVSDIDFEDIKVMGGMEYLIEFRLQDTISLVSFETEYVNAGLESNGPALSYSLFQMLNAITDGIMIAMILLISFLIVAITFLCIRFTLLAKIDDDYREIGVMKAIGLRISDIKKIYLAKYAAISFVGGIVGFALSFVFKGKLLENIKLYMGESENTSLAMILGIIGIIIVFLAIITYVRVVLRRFKKISATEAIRFGTIQQKYAKANFFSLNKTKILNTNIFLGLKDVLTRKKLYITMLIVLIISTFIIVVPQNLYNTVSSREFTNYMGSGLSDMSINIQQTDNISIKVDEVLKALDEDVSVSDYSTLTTKSYLTKLDDGTEERLRVDLGDHTLFPLKYTEGEIPTEEDEIALSVLNADELGKKVGDKMIIVVDDKEKVMKVCGIYSDITNGGKTAKVTFSDSKGAVMWYNISVNLNDSSLIDKKVKEYSEDFSFAKVVDIDEFANQTFGSTIESVYTVSQVAIVIAVVIIILVTLLFMKMLVTKDKYSIAIMKSLGFTSNDVVKQYMSRSIFVLIIGIVIGIILANTVGEILASALIATFGATAFSFTINPMIAYLLCPVIIICATLVATILGTLDIGKIKISENIKE